MYEPWYEERSASKTCWLLCESCPRRIQSLGGSLAPDALVGRFEEALPLGHGDEKERVVAHLDEELGVDLVVGEVRVRLRRAGR